MQMLTQGIDLINFATSDEDGEREHTTVWTLITSDWARTIKHDSSSNADQ